MARVLEYKVSDGASPTIAALIASLEQRKPLHAAMGKRVEVEYRDHFAARDSEGNKQGWPSQHFWARIRTATAYRSADEAGAIVGIADPALAQKIHGGTITPKEGKYLTIPAIAEAYGHSARSFDFLQFRRFKSGAAALVESDRTFLKFGRKRKDGSRKLSDEGRSQRGRVWYWLARSVTQKADARALPDEEKMTAALLEEIGEFFERVRG